ncbi:MAG: dienelactone hydrolase family protein [Paludibacter sp.]
MIKNKVALFLFSLLGSSLLSGQNRQELPLYPNGIENNPVIHAQKESFVDSVVNPNSLSKLNRVYSFVSVPTYTLFPASESNNKHIGVVIFPGGGLVNNWVDKEGTDLAIWLSAKGISCLVVKYRTNEKDKNGKFLIPYDDYKGAIYKDARTGILKLKELSAELKVDADKIGIIGFSAGGWLSERMAFKSVDGTFDWKPSFVGLIYHGDIVQEINKIKNKADLPPFFMAIARDDRKIPLKKVIPFLTAIVTEVDKSELHIYSKGDHGFGLAYDKGNSVALWKDSFYCWLLDIYNK